ncbi:Vacuolar protein sorting-associated protein 52 [Malassezia vespertilionis]|uniref:Vps52 coiled-coil domain-containing protein n=1 Tax=Malassezia vespertilionis TaxID=2020962 RepID=A0A2N1JGU0_9BASI|nr:Vacuolar protein sorting-associated protein 52 [Malassezia vespertilionis]PKI85766.1 hypothetical protein MVES_000723 [Malassezia vespertilionis]WFD05433.1 Vacuolar protein sorting-associated protein 52 [Malassezia vespertilionis]
MAHVVPDAAALASLAAQRPVQDVCKDMVAQLETRDDATWDARSATLESMARDVMQSRTLLDSMRTQLQGFHHELQSTSEHIESLQNTSSALTDRVRDEEQRASQLSQWLLAAALPPSVVRTVHTTRTSEDPSAWLDAVQQLEVHLEKMHTQFAENTGSALDELAAVGEQCKRTAIAKIRPYLLGLIEPIKTSVSTTLPILQSSVLLPNQPLYQFLAAHAPRAGAEVQLAYVNAARIYYDAAFRRYVRALKRILPRWSDGAHLVAHAWRANQERFAMERLKFARPSATDAPILAYMSEEPGFRVAPEHLFHTLALVFLDTACSEYAFLARFFSGTRMHAPVSAEQMLCVSESEAAALEANAGIARETWRQVMEPVLYHFDDFRHALLGVHPAPLLMLLVSATLATRLIALAKERRCLLLELESALMRHVLDTWALIAHALDHEVEALQLLSIGKRHDATGARAASFFERWGATFTTDAPIDLLCMSGAPPLMLRQLCDAYATKYLGVLQLHGAEIEGSLQQGYVLYMDSHSLVRMRKELERLVREYAENYWKVHAGEDADAPRRLCEWVAEQFAPFSDTQAQQEMAHWKALAASLS